MRIILILFFTLTLYGAEDFAMLYQSKGISKVIVALDKELTKKSYWKNRLQDIDTTYGYLENRDALITCNKKDASLHFFKRDKEGKFHKENSFKALTGKMNGDKQEEGDNKTPIGIYKLTKKLDKLDPFYGPLAYVTSYPNLYDKIRGKDGSGIWIHGVPDNTTREKYTKGCIALENDDILCLEDKLNFQNAWLIIDDTVNFHVTKETLASVLSQLFSWRYAWLNSHINDYLSFYDNSFVRFDGIHYQRFKKYKTRVFRKNEKKEIFFTNINVIPYPGERTNLYMISFHEKYHTSSYNFEGEKELIVLQNEGQFKILAER